MKTKKCKQVAPSIILEEQDEKMELFFALKHKDKLEADMQTLRIAMNKAATPSRLLLNQFSYILFSHTWQKSEKMKCILNHIINLHLN